MRHNRATAEQRASFEIFAAQHGRTHDRWTWVSQPARPTLCRAWSARRFRECRAVFETAKHPANEAR